MPNTIKQSWGFMSSALYKMTSAERGTRGSVKTTGMFNRHVVVFPAGIGHD